MSTAAAASDVLHITTKFDDSVHEYQFARSNPQLFAQLQQLTAKYPLTPLYIHYRDEDGDMVRVTSEAELREAVRVCGAHLTLVLSASLPSSSSASSSSSSAAHQPSVASSTLLSHTPSPSPSLTSVASSSVPASMLVAGGLDGGAVESIDDIDDYLSSDDELFEQARSQVRSQLSQHSIPDVEAQAKVEPEPEPESPQFDVVAMDSDGASDTELEDDEEVKEELATPKAATAVHVVVEHAVQPAVEPATQSASTGSDTSAELKEQPRAELHDDTADVPRQPQPASPLSSQPEQPRAVSTLQPLTSPTSQLTEQKHDSVDIDPITAINARLRSFYQLDQQLDQQRQAILSSATAAYPVAAPVHSPPSSVPVPVATLFNSFFAEPVVVATIRDHSVLLMPFMVSSTFPLFLHQLCLLNPVLSSHPLTRYTFSLSSLHPFTVCVHCSASPVIGRLLYCRCCDVTLCGTCGQQSQHPVDHELTELAVTQYRRETDVASTFSSSAAVMDSAVRLDGGRVLEQRKASDFAELSDRMRAGGQRAWKQGAVSLRRMDEVLAQFAADVKRMVDSLLDGIFHDAPKQSQQPAEQQQQQQQQAEEEQKQQPLMSPRSRQSQPPTACNVRRAPCIPASRPNPAATAAAREAGIALAQPVRQSMTVEPRVQQQASSEFSYRAQLDQMGDMGLIKSAVDEETCKELLTASKGNVDQAVYWLMEKINV